jgi:hypothetical protein
MDAGLDVHEHVFSPEPVDDLVAGDELGAALDEQDEEIHGLCREGRGDRIRGIR